MLLDSGHLSPPTHKKEPPDTADGKSFPVGSDGFFLYFGGSGSVQDSQIHTGVVMGEDLLEVRPLPGHVVGAVLAQSHPVPIALGVDGEKSDRSHVVL